LCVFCVQGGMVLSQAKWLLFEACRGMKGYIEPVGMSVLDGVWQEAKRRANSRTVDSLHTFFQKYTDVFTCTGDGEKFKCVLTGKGRQIADGNMEILQEVLSHAKNAVFDGKASSNSKWKEKKGNRGSEKNELSFVALPTERNVVPLSQQFEQIEQKGEDSCHHDEPNQLELPYTLVNGVMEKANRVSYGVHLRHWDSLDDIDSWGLLGKLSGEEKGKEKQVEYEDDELVYLNTKEPFCAVLIGVQGSGKSHSTACLIENCLLSAHETIDSPRPPCSLVFHYDTDE
jgi:hypothetical protein